MKCSPFPSRWSVLKGAKHLYPTSRCDWMWLQPAVVASHVWSAGGPASETRLWGQSAFLTSRDGLGCRFAVTPSVYDVAGGWAGLSGHLPPDLPGPADNGAHLPGTAQDAPSERLPDPRKLLPARQTWGPPSRASRGHLPRTAIKLHFGRQAPGKVTQF